MSQNKGVVPVNDRSKAATNNTMDMWRASIEQNRQKQETLQGSETAYKPRLEQEGMYKKECKTCAERKYQDGSDDSGVSFQTPGHISPGMSAATVMSHEREHVVRDKAKAEREGGEVISSTVSLNYSFCPECGRPYVAGGQTHTVTETPVDSDAAKKKAAENARSLQGLDAKV